MNDLSKYVELYRQASEHDTETLWFKVRTIRDAIADGADVETLLSECGKESGDSRKQVRKFYAVARVFSEETIAKDMDYWTHEVCATAPGVDLDDWQTYVIAHQWLVTAGHREIKRGKTTIHAKHTARTLRKLIRAAANASASAKPVVEAVYKGEAIYHGYEIGSWKTELTLSILDGINPVLEYLEWGETVTVTITRTRQPETVSGSADAVNEGSEAA